MEEKALQFVRDWGKQCVACAVTLELAIIGMLRVWEACPWIQTNTDRYNADLMHKHLEALRLGFSSGHPFHQHSVPVFPLALHGEVYTEDMQEDLKDALHHGCFSHLRHPTSSSSNHRYG